ncbi:MAG TPA: hypothetical protein VK811_09705 [Candidatus Acidoferrum sp.]|nr:hypothetical protein [Candidatus Acidoferrum sp.]
MKSKIVSTGMSLLAGLTLASAANISIPDSSFQNVNAALNAPVLGTLSGNIGTWSAQFTNVLNLGGQIAASNAAAVDWVTPPSGSGNELRISLPASAGVSAGISENLTNRLQPDSVYTLTVDLDSQSTLNLLGNASLNLYAVGSTNLASVQGTTLIGIMIGSSGGFQTATLTYKTPNVVPSEAIGVSLNLSSIAGGGGTLYVDNFQMTVAPIQVQVASSFSFGQHGSNSTMTMSGQGGAPGATYKIITSTNILTSTPVWSVMTTNQFDANGNFSQTFNINPNTPYRFFRTVVP